MLIDFLIWINKIACEYGRGKNGGSSETQVNSVLAPPPKKNRKKKPNCKRKDRKGK